MAKSAALMSLATRVDVAVAGVGRSQGQLDADDNESIKQPKSKKAPDFFNKIRGLRGVMRRRETRSHVVDHDLTKA